MQTDLRLILISVGICIFIGIVWDGFSRVFKKKRRKSTEFDSTILESAQSRGATDFDEDPLMSPSRPKKQIKHPEEVIALTIIARSQNGFSGHSLHKSLRNLGFHFGKDRIFRKHFKNDPKKPELYSLVNILEPGTFEDNPFQAKSIVPGVMLLMIMPCNGDPDMIFDDLLETAQKLSNQLPGDLCDAHRSHLTAQTIEHYRERIRENTRKALANQRTYGE